MNPDQPTTTPALPVASNHGGAEALSGVDLIRKERQRQISEEEWTPQHDDTHAKGELCAAAGVYALIAASRAASDVGVEGALTNARHIIKDYWPDGWKINPKSCLSDLIRAGALIAAEIDRLQRKSAQTTVPPVAGAAGDTPMCRVSSSEALHMLTCVHHTDAERAALPPHGNCPVCAQRETAALTARLAERDAECGELKARWNRLDSEHSALRERELMRGNVLGRIAIALYEKDNVTDEECVTGVKALALTCEQYRKASELFNADIVELLARCQRGQATCIFTAQIIEAETDKIRTQLATAQQERDGMIEAWNSLAESDSIVASCNCGTKTNDIQYHKPGCKYRIIVERDTSRDALTHMTGKNEVACQTISAMQREREERGSFIALANLSAWLGVGSGDGSVTAEAYEKRIREGVDMITAPLVADLTAARADLAESEQKLSAALKSLGLVEHYIPKALENVNLFVELTAERDALRAPMKRLLDVLGECQQHDHHGNCQTHFVSNPCPVELARKALASAPATPKDEDSAMLDWLEKNSSDFECTSSATDFSIFIAKRRNDEHGPHFSHSTLRDAIRAAMNP